MAEHTFAEAPEVYLTDQGYSLVRLLPTGEWAGLQRMAFTCGLFVGLDETGWRTRFCFETEDEARNALSGWDGQGFPPGYWIKQKPEEIMNPARDARRP